MESSILRQRARNNLAGKWGVSIGVAAVAALLGGLLWGVSFLPQIDSKTTVFIPGLKEFLLMLEEDLRLGNFTVSFRISGLLSFILGGVLQLGYCQFLLKQHDGQDVEFNDLFSQFERFGDGFAQKFLRTLYVSLWSLLFIIPGIMKSYSYAMTPFIMIDHPELTASQAIDASKELMDGYKAELFYLELSFLGWGALAIFTDNLGYLLLNPYTNAARAAFYRQLVAEQQDTVLKPNV